MVFLKRLPHILGWIIVFGIVNIYSLKTLLVTLIYSIYLFTTPSLIYGHSIQQSFQNYFNVGDHSYVP